MDTVENIKALIRQAQANPGSTGHGHSYVDPVTKRTIVKTEMQVLQQQLASAEQAAARAVTPAARSVFSRVLSTLGRTALRLIGVEVVAGGAAAIAAGAVLTTVALAPIAYYGAQRVGNWTGYTAVEPGVRMRQPPAEPVTVPAATGSEKVAIFLLPDNSGGTIWIGQESVLKTLRGCDTPNGGRCEDPNITYPPVKYEKKSQDFETTEEATAELCRVGTIEGGYWGQKVAAYGGHYWWEGSCPAPTPGP